MAEFEAPLPFKEIKEKTDKYVLGTYKRAPVSFYFGQGEYVFDTENKRYIDFLCGISVTSLGHGDADIIETIRTQADRIIHSSNLFYNQEQALLAEALVSYTFPGKVFFCNSGTEANEAAMKLARRYGVTKGSAATVVTLEKSFHGRTMGSMTLTGQEKIHQGFGPLAGPVQYIPADQQALETVLNQKGAEICAVFLELVQGEGGVRPLSREFVHTARELTKENDILLVIDEVQTGMGRTGSFLAYEQYDIVPDVVTMAKALGSGFPIGAMIVADPFVDVLGPGMHGSTFGGNHLAAAVAFDTLRILHGREIIKNVQALSEYFFTRLRAMQAQIPVMKDVRGLGLLIGIELDQPGAPVVDACREAGLLINCTADTVIRLLPPLTISLEVAAEGLDILEKELRKLKAK